MKQHRWSWPAAAIALAATLLVAGCGRPVYKDPQAGVEQRVEDLLSRLKADEKLEMLSGAGWMESHGNERLGIPRIHMADGPMGIRAWTGPSNETNAQNARVVVTSTAFPVGLAMAATWNPEIAAKEGQVIGREARALGRDQVLGPTVNIARTPVWGRNFEGYGEDPYLASQMAVGYIKGMQGEKVIATVKHFAANNQEEERLKIDEKISERALEEIYFPAFRAAVEEAGVWSVMSAYNKVNGRWCAENATLLQDVLKGRWGFKGHVVSDWGSTHSTADTVNAGMDLEMPGGEVTARWLEKSRATGSDGLYLLPDKLRPLVAGGQIKEAAVDDAVRRLLRTMFTAGLFDRTNQPAGEVDTADQRAVARTAAMQSVVLLKNQGDLLPLDAGKLKAVAVIGPNAAVARMGGGGSSMVRAKNITTPLDGIREKAGTQFQVGYALGIAMPGEDPTKDTPEERAALQKEAADLAAKADVALLFVGDGPKVESEGFDRKSMDLPEGQEELIRAVAAANKNTVVVLNVGSPVAMGWLDKAPAVLNAWFPGQEGGTAVADVLFGDANPSGKLPMTFPKAWKDSPAHRFYPGQNGQTEYGEGIFVGYRYFDRPRAAVPLFPFGFGLSYTTFALSDLAVTPAKLLSGQKVSVAVKVRNSGTRAGAEVVQVYVREVRPRVERPVKELKAFRRVELKPGEVQDVKFLLDQSALSYYDSQKKAWQADAGRFEVQVGDSSRDIKLKAAFELLP